MTAVVKSSLKLSIGGMKPNGIAVRLLASAFIRTDLCLNLFECLVYAYSVWLASEHGQLALQSLCEISPTAVLPKSA